MNLRFEYLYRDAGNYKKWGEIIFSNTKNFAIEIAEKLISDNLDERLYFKAEDLNIPDLHDEVFDPSIDHDWHEFHGCFGTTDPATNPDQRDIQTIIGRLSALNKEGKYLSRLRS